MLPGILRKPKQAKTQPTHPTSKQQGPNNQQNPNQTKPNSKPHKTENKQ